MATVDGLVEDFQKETGITLMWVEDSEHMTDEEPVGFNPLSDVISYHTSRWEERFARVSGFSLEIGGTMVSGQLQPGTTFAHVDAESGEILEGGCSQEELLGMIRRACPDVDLTGTALEE